MPSEPPTPPLGDLKYLYVGTSRFDDDLEFYRDVVGAEEVWNFEEFGARVAALRVAAGPLLLIADHRPAPELSPGLRGRRPRCGGDQPESPRLAPDSGPFGIPDGPCYLFSDRSGNQLAIFGNARPDALSAVRRR